MFQLFLQHYALRMDISNWAVVKNDKATVSLYSIEKCTYPSSAGTRERDQLVRMKCNLLSIT